MAAQIAGVAENSRQRRLDADVEKLQRAVHVELGRLSATPLQTRESSLNDVPLETFREIWSRNAVSASPTESYLQQALDDRPELVKSLKQLIGFQLASRQIQAQLCTLLSTSNGWRLDLIQLYALFGRSGCQWRVVKELVILSKSGYDFPESFARLRASQKYRRKHGAGRGQNREVEWLAWDVQNVLKQTGGRQADESGEESDSSDEGGEIDLCGSPDEGGGREERNAVELDDCLDSYHDQRPHRTTERDEQLPPGLDGEQGVGETQDEPRDEQLDERQGGRPAEQLGSLRNGLGRECESVGEEELGVIEEPDLGYCDGASPCGSFTALSIEQGRRAVAGRQDFDSDLGQSLGVDSFDENDSPTGSISTETSANARRQMRSPSRTRYDLGRGRDEDELFVAGSPSPRLTPSPDLQHHIDDIFEPELTTAVKKRRLVADTCPSPPNGSKRRRTNPETPSMNLLSNPDVPSLRRFFSVITAKTPSPACAKFLLETPNTACAHDIILNDEGEIVRCCCFVVMILRGRPADSDARWVGGSMVVTDTTWAVTVYTTARSEGLVHAEDTSAIVSFFDKCLPEIEGVHYANESRRNDPEVAFVCTSGQQLACHVAALALMRTHGEECVTSHHDLPPVACDILLSKTSDIHHHISAHPESQDVAQLARRTELLALAKSRTEEQHSESIDPGDSDTNSLARLVGSLRAFIADVEYKQRSDDRMQALVTTLQRFRSALGVLLREIEPVQQSSHDHAQQALHELEVDIHNLRGMKHIDEAIRTQAIFDLQEQRSVLLGGASEAVMIQIRTLYVVRDWIQLFIGDLCDEITQSKRVVERMRAQAVPHLEAARVKLNIPK